MTLEEAYLEHILLHLRSNDPDDRPLRTYFDSWYAHSIGPDMMERQKPRPQWLNRGDLEKRSELAWHCHAISTEAEQRINRGEFTDLAKDHSIPVSQLIEELKSSNFQERDQIRSYLIRRYRVAVVTQDEHEKLRKGDLARRRSKQKLTSQDGVYYRYDCPEYGIKYRILKG